MVVAALATFAGRSHGQDPADAAREPVRSPTSSRDWRTLQVLADHPPVALPFELAPGDRLLIESGGGVDGGAADPWGGIGAGALVGRFVQGPPFLVGTGPLVWSAPSAGTLVFDVMRRPGFKLAGGYTVRILAIGPRGDPRQSAFPSPTIAFLPRRSGDPFLALRYADRAGFGLDLKTLTVVLETEAGQRFVLSDGFEVEATGATLTALPPEIVLPPGVHRIRATIGDALGNVSMAAEIFVDQP